MSWFGGESKSNGDAVPDSNQYTLVPSNDHEPDLTSFSKADNASHSSSPSLFLNGHGLAHASSVGIGVGVGIGVDEEIVEDNDEDDGGGDVEDTDDIVDGHVAGGSVTYQRERSDTYIVAYMGLALLIISIVMYFTLIYIYFPPISISNRVPSSQSGVVLHPHIALLEGKELVLTNNKSTEKDLSSTKSEQVSQPTTINKTCWLGWCNEPKQTTLTLDLIESTRRAALSTKPLTIQRTYSSPPPSDPSPSPPSPYEPLSSVLTATSTGLRTLDDCVRSSIPLRRVALILTSAAEVTDGILTLASLEAGWCIAVLATRKDVQYKEFSQSFELRWAEWMKVHQIERNLVEKRIAFIETDELHLLPYIDAPNSTISYNTHSYLQNAGVLLAIHAGAEIIVEIDPSYIYQNGSSHTHLNDLPIDYRSSIFPLAENTGGIFYTQTEAISPTRILRSMSLIPDTAEESVSLPVSYGIFNPLPYFAIENAVENSTDPISSDRPYPRGFPLSLARNSTTTSRFPSISPSAFKSYLAYASATASLTPPIPTQINASLGAKGIPPVTLPPATGISMRQCLPIIQYFSVHDGEIDAISTFERKQRKEKLLSSDWTDTSLRLPRLVLPFDAYIPTSARSTAYLSPSFFSLYLPITLPSPTADIIRSYITQTLLTYTRPPTRPFGPAPLVSASIPNPILQTHYGADTVLENLGPDPLALTSSTIQPCILVTPPHMSKSTETDQSIDEAFSQESTLYSSIDVILAYLSERRRGHRMDLQMRVRDAKISRGEDFDEGEGETMAEIMILLYTDLYEVGVVEEDDTKGVTIFLQNLARFTPSSPLLPSSPPPLAPTPLPSYLPYLPPRQQTLAICLQFNRPAVLDENSAALFLTLLYQSLLHRHVTFVFPFPVDSLATVHQRTIAMFPNVGMQLCAHAEQDNGFNQHWCMQYCLERYKAEANGTVYDRIQGLLWVGDDIFFNYSQVLYPLPITENPPPPIWQTSNDPALAHLTFPFDEFWFPPAVDLEDMRSDVTKGRSGWNFLQPNYPYFKHIKDAYLDWPDEYKRAAGLFDGEYMLWANTVSDVLFIPKAHNQWDNLHKVILSMRKYQSFMVFSEVHMPSLLQLTMGLSHRPMINVGGQMGAEIAWGGDLINTRRNFFIQVNERMKEYSEKKYEHIIIDSTNGILSLNDSNITYNMTFRPRPIPMARSANVWNNERYNPALLKGIVEGGEPVYIHPLKLSDVRTEGVRIWRDGYEKQFVLMREGKKAKAKKKPIEKRD